MKNLFFLSIAVSMIFFASCGKNSSEYRALKAQNDSLLLSNAKNASELEEILALFNEVEENFESIKAAENYLNVQSGKTGDLTPSIKERVRSDMQLVTEILTKNKDKIAELELKLKNSSFKSSQLQKTIEGLRAELESKTKDLVAVNAELERKDRQISALSANVSALSRDVEKLSELSKSQQKTIADQEKSLNSVYYCYGTAKELKEHKILKNGKMQTDFDTNYFIHVPNYNELTTIPLLAKKGIVLSKHPTDSYEFIKDANKQVSIHILDPKSFWSLTKYLVVEVKL